MDIKKVMTVAASLAAGAVMAADGIVSSSVVGYQNFEVVDGIVSAGAAFTPVNTDGKWTCETTVLDNDAAAGDFVNVFSSEVWNLNYWQFKGFKGTGESNGWAYNYTDTETWEPADMVVSSFELEKGDAVYFLPYDTVSGLTVAGMVADTTKPATWTLAANELYGDIMNPFPVATTLADLETFAKAGDVIHVFNPKFWNLDSYQYKGSGRGWAYYTFSDKTWEAIDSVVTDTTTVVLPAGIGGCYQPYDQDGRTWTVSL